MAEKGSRIFPDTVPFQKKHADELKDKMDKYLAKLGLKSTGVGSTADPGRDPEDYASDLDTMVDLDDIIKNLDPKVNPADKKDTIEKAARRELAAAIKKLGLETSQTGVNVFVRMPLGDAVHQIDLECIRKVSKVSKYHQHKIPKGSPYKGVNKQLIISILAKQMGYVYSAWEGLYVRTPDNKKGDLVADEWDEIAKMLLGPSFNGSNLSSVEEILKSLPKDKAAALLDKAKQDPNWKEVPKKENVELKRIKQLSGLV